MRQQTDAETDRAVGLASTRSVNHRQHAAVGGVYAFVTRECSHVTTARSPLANLAPAKHPPVLFHAIDHADLVAVLEIGPDAGRSTRTSMPCRSSSSLGPMPDNIKSCGVLNAPPQRITSRPARAWRISPGSELGLAWARYSRSPFEIFNPDGALVCVKQHAAGQGIDLDLQALGKTARHTRVSAPGCPCAYGPASSAARSRCRNRCARPRASHWDRPWIRKETCSRSCFRAMRRSLQRCIHRRLFRYWRRRRSRNDAAGAAVRRSANR